MNSINKIYINGEFITPIGTETLALLSPVTNQQIASVRLGNEQDTQNAIAAAKNALKTFSKTSPEERVQYLEKLHQAVQNRQEDLVSVMVEEYGGTYQFCSMIVQFALEDFNAMIAVLKEFDFEQKTGNAKVQLQAVGVAGIIIPWNMSNGFICTKIATVLAAGCTAVVKPSELSAQQTQIMAECVHAAGLPKGVINFVNGLGEVVGAELTRNPGVNKISFTGSTAVGKIIAKGAVESMKRVTLELGGKSPNIILADADLEQVVPTAVMAAFLNSGQACAAGTRLLVPQDRLSEVNTAVKAFIEHVKVGNPADHDTLIGPIVSQKQYAAKPYTLSLAIAIASSSSW